MWILDDCFMYHNHDDIISATTFHILTLHLEFILLINLQGVAITNPTFQLKILRLGETKKFS